MNKIHKTININGQFVAPNRKSVEEPKDVRTFNLCKLLNF